MKGPKRTTRQRIAAFLREQPAEAGQLANEFDVTTAAALSHVEHVAESLDGTDEELLVSPPERRGLVRSNEGRLFGVYSSPFVNRV